MDKEKNVGRDEWIVELILKTENMTQMELISILV